MQFSTAAVARTAHHLAAINSNQVHLSIYPTWFKFLIYLSIQLGPSCFKTQALYPSLLNPAPYVFDKAKRTILGFLVHREYPCSSQRRRSRAPPTTSPPSTATRSAPACSPNESIHLSIYLSIYQSIYLSIYRSIRIFIYLSIYLYVYIFFPTPTVLGLILQASACLSICPSPLPTAEVVRTAHHLAAINSNQVRPRLLSRTTHLSIRLPIHPSIYSSVYLSFP